MLIEIYFRARKNDTEEGYKMTDQDLMEQVVNITYFFSK